MLNQRRLDSIGRWLSVTTFVVAFVAVPACTRGVSPKMADAALEQIEDEVGDAEAVSFLGEPLYRMPLAPDLQAKREEQLHAARLDYQRDPTDPTNIIWYGRRTAYLGRYRDAIGIFTAGLRVHPESVRLLRHRGHRWITVRRLDDAITDLEAAIMTRFPDAFEPDGLPNRRGIPTSTTNGNVCYHLGLAHYLRADYGPALAAYKQGQTFVRTDDMRVAMTYWQYLTLRRMGFDREARSLLDNTVTPDLDIIENTTYYNLLRLFKGEIDADALAPDPDNPVGAAIDDATLAYGLGAWHLTEGRTEQAHAMFEVIAQGDAWPAFGLIAAEAELARAAGTRP